jgi:hypothetical protein
MGCGCNKTAPAPEPEFEVSLPSGEKVFVTGEHAARVMVTRAGGGTYSKR